MKELTKAEEQVMQILWKIEEGFVKDIIELYDDPKPAYNTVSTIVRILEKKGFVDHKAYGKTHMYFPLVSKDEYKRDFIKNFMKSYFSNSFEQMVSFFTKNKDVSTTELEEIKSLIEEQINTEKNQK
ncbi:MAG: transcriptional regulator [Marinilabiliales bacterium]|nr:MAG: transcriptional regulator [Marinilabiliales bacterium]